MAQSDDRNVVDIRHEMPVELYRYLKRLAKQRRQTFQSLLNQLCEEHVHCLHERGTLLPFDFE